MNKVKVFLSEVLEIFFSDSFTQKITIGFFGVLGICSLIASFYNPWQLVIAIICSLIVVSFLKK